MVTYSTYSKTVELLVDTVVDQMLKPMAFREYENEYGYTVQQTLPGSHVEFVFEKNGFTGHVDSERLAFENPQYGELSILRNTLAARPDEFIQAIPDLYTAYDEVFGKVTMAYQPDHPGEPPLSQDELESAFTQLNKQKELLCASPMLEDMVDAFCDKNYRLAAQFLHRDDWQEMFDPSSGHELAPLFMNGDISVVYSDGTLALLKPEFNNEVWARVLAQRRGRGWVPSLNPAVEIPEEAYVVGIDDTPAGLFAHAVDGTRLDPNQSTTREYIHDVMDFDYSYEHTPQINCDLETRIRLQGDLAMKCIHRDSHNIESGRLNLPIDNHLLLFTNARLAPGEDTEEEPIRVQVGTECTLNILHDEHEQVVSELLPGEYEFYLLRRGLQPENTRPDWPNRNV